MMTSSDECFVGIDVSQARLDVALMPGDVIIVPERFF